MIKEACSYSEYIVHIKLFYKTIFGLLLLVACPLISEAQSTYSVSGIVKDEKGKVFPGATVFFSGTKLFTACNENGQFQFKKLLPGTYQIVIRAIGYKLLTKPVNLIDRDITTNFQIFSSTEKLAEVMIKPDKQWYKNLKIFKQQFLGETSNALKCKIQNAEILSFDFNTHTKILKGNATDPIIIINAALGYKLTYFLTNFIYNQQRNSVVYQGYPYFEELAGTDNQKITWTNNRKLAYEGSLHSLICALYKDDLSNQGFSIYRIKNPLPIITSNGNPILIDPSPLNADSLFTTKNQPKLLFSKKSILIVFKNQKEAGNYVNRNYSIYSLINNPEWNHSQLSVINFVAPVVIDQLGSYNPTQGIFTEGYMGWGRIGDLTPFGYNNNN